MVDLVKIRKKAKKTAASRDSPATEGPERGVTGHERPVAEATQRGEAPLSLESVPATGNPPPATSEAASDGSVAVEAPRHTEGPSSGEPLPATNELQPVTTSKLDRFIAEAGQRRVRQVVAEEETTAADAGVLELLTFIIAGEQYAVEIERIVEIVTPRPVTRIPNANASVVGIISLRGAIVTLVDVRRKLRHPTGTTSAPDPRVVVVEQLGETVGFEVERVVRVVKVGRGAIEAHPVVHISEQDQAIRGVFRQGGALTILLDLDKLLDGRALASPLA